MKFAMCLEPEVGPKWAHARQLGVDHAVVLGGSDGQWDLTDFRQMALLKNKFEDAGLSLQVIEGMVPMEQIKQGGPGRDKELERFCTILRNMGAAGIPVLCYSWMTFLSWARTSFTERGRGGALVSSYDHALTERAPESKGERIAEAKLWETLTYFLKAVVPVAEAAGVRLALHPDDPPLPKVLGVARLFGKPENFDRALAIVDSPANALCFCQANFSLMGDPAAVPDLIRHYAEKIAFVHFRDVQGTATRFSETFHDEGHTDMWACMRAYRDIGFEGPIRPDHAPNMEGDPNTKPGYEALGRLFAFGYMRGLLEGVDRMRAQGSA